MDSAIHDTLVGLITTAACLYGLVLVMKMLKSGRDDLDISRAVYLAFGIRVVASFIVTLTGFGEFLRGLDEVNFLGDSRLIVDSNFGSQLWLDSITGSLYETVFSAQLSILDSPDGVLRITQCAISVTGLALLATSVHELAGARAGRVAMWCLALEPANVFFSSLLHKEPNMFLASGLVAFGATMIWKRAQPRYLLLIALGCLIAVATRPYAGWFLIAAGGIAVLHAGFRTRDGSNWARGFLVGVVILLAAFTAPLVIDASSEENLDRNLQNSQDTNAANDDANLSLEQVDFSSRTAIITNLPTRIRDVLVRPYPWQVENVSQQLAVLGTAVTLAVLFYLIRMGWRRRRELFAIAGPLIYTAFFLLIAYSLSTGNAGTGFRYRTHVTAVLICIAVVLHYAPSRAPAKARQKVKAKGKAPARASDPSAPPAPGAPDPAF